MCKADIMLGIPTSGFIILVGTPFSLVFCPGTLRYQCPYNKLIWMLVRFPVRDQGQAQQFLLQ